MSDKDLNTTSYLQSIGAEFSDNARGDEVVAIIVDPDGLNQNPDGSYTFKMGGGSDPAFKHDYISLGKGFGPDDIALSTADGAKRLGEMLREHIAQHGPDDLIIAQHGSPGSVAGKMKNPSVLDLYYRQLFREIPEGIQSIYIDSCSSGSALHDVNRLPSGTMLFTTVGETLDYGNLEQERDYAKQTRDRDLDPATLYKQVLLQGDYPKYPDRIERDNQENGTHYSTDWEDIVPTEVGIAGYPPDGVVDLRDHFQAFKGKPEYAQQIVDALIEDANVDEFHEKGRFWDGSSGLREVAEMLANGEAIPPEKLAIASAIAFQHLEDSGEIAKMVAQAKENERVVDRVIEKPEPEYELKSDITVSELLQGLHNSMSDISQALVDDGLESFEHRQAFLGIRVISEHGGGDLTLAEARRHLRDGTDFAENMSTADRDKALENTARIAEVTGQSHEAAQPALPRVADMFTPEEIEMLKDYANLTSLGDESAPETINEIAAPLRDLPTGNEDTARGASCTLSIGCSQ